MSKKANLKTKLILKIDFVQNPNVHHVLSEQQPPYKDPESLIISSYLIFPLKTQVVKIVELNYLPVLQIIS